MRYLTVTILLCMLFLSHALQAVETNTNPSNAYLARIRANQSNNWNANIAVVIGITDFLEPEWAGADRQETVGLMFDVGKDGWIANLAVDVFTSSGDGNNGSFNVEGSISEIDVGFRMHIYDNDINWGAYIGGGAAIMDSELDIGAVNETASDLGVWGNVGIYYQLEDRWNFGADIRYSAPIIGFEDSDTINPSNFSYTLTFGYHF